MNTFQTCRNTTDAVPLYLPQHLYLKPIARIYISMQLPNTKKKEKSVSYWEIMEKIRTLIKPDEFSILKVAKTTADFVRFEAELDNKTRLDKAISKLDNNSIKLKDFSDTLRLKAAKAKSEFPTRHIWDNFFHDAKDMDDMRPGERPDTLHVSNLPIEWFVFHSKQEESDVLPSEKIFYRTFEKFGPIRYVDIPICDPYRKKMKDHISGFRKHSPDAKNVFEGYVQFKDYIGFTKTMDALKDMKLLRKEGDEASCVDMKVDFDRSKHLSDASIRRREIVRERLVKKQREREEKEKNELEEKKAKEDTERQKEIEAKLEKEKRRKEREEKRKAKILEKLKIGGCDEINEKIAREERKLLKVQRKLEAIRILEELFRRINDKRESTQDLYKKIQNSGCDELKRYKNTSELQVLTQRQKLHHAIEGRIILKTILSENKKSQNFSSSSSDTSLSPDEDDKKKDKPIAETSFTPDPLYDWYGYSYPPAVYPPIRPHPSHYLLQATSRGRGYQRAGPSRSRGGFNRRTRNFNSRYRGNYGNKRYPPELEEEYYKYFSKFLTNQDKKSRSRSRSRHTRSYSRSSSRSRTRSHSRSRLRRRERRRSSRRSREKSHYTPEKKDNSKSRSTSVDSSKFIPRKKRKSNSPSTPRKNHRQKSWSKSPTRS